MENVLSVYWQTVGDLVNVESQEWWDKYNQARRNLRRKCLRQRKSTP